MMCFVSTGIHLYLCCRNSRIATRTEWPFSSAKVPISPMTTSLPANIADFTSVLDDVVASANAAAAAAEDETGDDFKDDKRGSKSAISYCSSSNGNSLLNQNLPKFPHHPLDSLLTPAASPEEDSLEPWIQTV